MGEELHYTLLERLSSTSSDDGHDGSPCDLGAMSPSRFLFFSVSLSRKVLDCCLLLFSYFVWCLFLPGPQRVVGRCHSMTSYRMLAAGRRGGWVLIDQANLHHWT